MSEKCYSGCQRTGEALCRCAVAHVVQSPSTVEWGVYCCLGDRDWVEPITITLAVCGCPPAISLSPQADGRFVSLPSLHWRVCVCARVTRLSIGLYVCAWPHIKLYVAITWESSFPSIAKGYLKIPSYRPQRRAYCTFLCLLQVLSRGARVMRLDWIYVREYVIR